MNKNYTKLNISTKILPDIREIINDGGEWGMLNSFQIKQIPHSLAMKDEFLKKLFEKHKFLIGVLKLEPNNVYNWHIDGERAVGINALIEESNSHCLFIDNIVNDYVFETSELKYQVGEYVVFNTSIPHMVINFEKERYMLTVKFSEKISYEELLATF